jgi:RNA polymerase sigma-54 factor
MSLELRQQLKLAQKLVMTQQLRQAIQLLQMNRLELTAALQTEMEQNPMLEEVDRSLEPSSGPESLSAVEEAANADAEMQITSQVAGDSPAAVAEVNWEDYANNFEADFSFAHEMPPADAPSRLDFASAAPGLTAFLAWQLTHLSLTEADMEIARCILGNLNGHGFLEAEIADICAETGCSAEEAEAVLRLVQSLDPPGIAARTLQESLLLQLDRKGLEDTLTWQIVTECMDELAGRNFAAIARRTGSTLREAQSAAAVLAELNPYPGNEYSNEQALYITPDVYVLKVGDQLVISLNNEDLPEVRLSAAYQELLDKNAAAEAKEYLQEKKRNALLLLNALDYRKSTICRVMESIVKFQPEFFVKGPGALKPLVLSDVAQELGVHESTVSRATANKYAHTPQGLYELKYFFSTAATTASDTGEELTAESIKQRLGQLIRAENPAKPCSDSKLAELLEAEGIKIARRTVAKYREQMKILPVKHRRRKD